MAGEDAPIAFKEHTQVWNGETEEFEPITLSYRSWNDRLWIDFSLDASSRKLDPLEAEYDLSRMRPGLFRGSATQTPHEQAQSFVQDWVDDRVLIDGILHNPVDEPLYEIKVPNTSPLICVRKCFTIGCGRTRWNCYRIDDLVGVQEHLDEIQTNYPGRTIYFESRFEILIPEAIKANPQAEALELDRESLQQSFWTFLNTSAWLFRGHKSALHRKEIRRFLAQQLLKLLEEEA